MRVSNLDVSIAGTYAAFFCSLGFERRSRFVAEALMPRALARYALGFDDRQLLNYQQNRDFFETQQFDIQHLSDSQLPEWLDRTAERMDVEEVATRRLLVDVSSMSRRRIAAFVETLCMRSWTAPTTIDFVYALGQFNEPPDENDIANTHVGPVSARFAGWAVQADLVPAVILGLGYEQDRALGAVEHIQPGDVWAFRPVSELSSYEAAVRSANEILLELIPKSHVIDYDVQRPLECYGKLQSLAAVLGEEANPILVPFGPKIFALCAMLVAAVDRRCAVWRVSAEGADVAQDRVASGLVCGLSVDIEPMPPDLTRRSG